MTVVHADLRALPGVLDRPALLPALEAVAQASRASGHSLALLTLDVDHFKGYQDEQGAAQAEQVLTQLALLLQQLQPNTARLAYLGADGLVMIRPAPGRPAAVSRAERRRDRIASALPQLGGRPPLSATVGVAA